MLDSDNFLHCELYSIHLQTHFIEKPKESYLIHSYSDRTCKGTVVNLTSQNINEGSIEITSTVPLIDFHLSVHLIDFHLSFPLIDFHL